MSDLDNQGRHGIALCRYGLILALFLLSAITYIDRTSISSAKYPIANELTLSDREMGLVFGSFALGYAAMQLPAGWLVDNVGARVALASAVGMWSLLTALTGAAWNYHSLLTIRLLFGGAEAAVYPGSARAIRTWLLPPQRGRANGVLFAGSRLGAALSYPLLAWMLVSWTWRFAFLLLALAGFIWIAGWLFLFGESVPGHLEHRLAEQPQFDNRCYFGTTLTAPFALAMLQYFASNFTNFICLSWMLPYLKTRYHVSISQAAVYSMAPLLFGAAAQGVAGLLVDRIYNSRMRLRSRQLPAMIGFSLAIIGLGGVIAAPSLSVAVIAFSVAIFGTDMTVCPSWVFCSDLTSTHTGMISSAMNMCGSIGALLSASAFPYFQQRVGGSSAYFTLAVVLDFAGILCWLGMKSASSSLDSKLCMGREAL